MVSEAGASVYSASDVARAEFPDLDVSMRGAVSIARRLQDPLAELVKIDPKSIGVGLYQHDVDQKKLAAALDAVVESVVNYVGVDVEHRLGAAAGLRVGHQQAAGQRHRRAPGRERPVRVAHRAEEGQGAGPEGVRAGRRLPARARQPQPAGQHDHPPRVVRRDEGAARAGRAEPADDGSAELAAAVAGCAKGWTSEAQGRQVGGRRRACSASASRPCATSSTRCSGRAAIRATTCRPSSCAATC